jgi:hypothetical protein
MEIGWKSIEPRFIATAQGVKYLKIEKNLVLAMAIAVEKSADNAATAINIGAIVVN